jgi:hypothetical protein
MTQQQLEERKVDREIINRLRATRRQIRKDRDRMGADAYGEYIDRVSMEAAEDYCRKNPGYQIVKFGGGYMLKKTDGTSQP